MKEKSLILTLVRDVQVATQLIIIAIDEGNVNLALKAVDNAQDELDTIRRLLLLEPPGTTP